jgi:hypothetical protein
LTSTHQYNTTKHRVQCRYRAEAVENLYAFMLPLTFGLAHSPTQSTRRYKRRHLNIPAHRRSGLFSFDSHAMSRHDRRSLRCPSCRTEFLIYKTRSKPALPEYPRHRFCFQLSVSAMSVRCASLSPPPLPSHRISRLPHAVLEIWGPVGPLRA